MHSTPTNAIRDTPAASDVVDAKATSPVHVVPQEDEPLGELGLPLPATVTLSRASELSGEYANMTFTLVAESTSDSDVAEGSTSSSAHSGTVVKLSSKRGARGAVFQAYDATIHRDGATAPCIVKIFDMEWLPTDQEVADECHLYTADDAREAALNEASVYQRLASLQGSIVPRYWGIGAIVPEAAAVQDARVLCVVMEDAGQEMPWPERKDPKIQERVIEMYSALHSAGVFHGDSEWRHIRRKQDGTLSLIDFDRSDINNDEEWWEEACESEIRDVWLGVLDTRPPK